MELEYQIPMISTFFLILLNIMFFSKEKIELKENKAYKLILICSLIVSLLDTFVHILSSNNDFNTLLMKYGLLISISNKIMSSLFVIIFSSLLFYNILISFEKIYQQSSKVKWIIIIFDIIICIFISLGNVNIIETSQARNVKGSSIIIGYSVVAILLTISTIIALLNIKKKDKRYTSIFGTLLTTIIMYVITIISPGIIIYDFILAIMCYIMYFTIENPDIKMLNQVELAKTQAEKANAAKTDFLSSMSHEIRTPLNAIVGFSNAIQEEETLEAAKQDAKDIILASENLLEIVNGILDISKIEANKMEIINTEYNLKEECENLIKLVKPRIGEKQIDLILSIAPDIPDYLYGDKGKMKEIMINLLTNAVKYTDKGTITFSLNCINKNGESSLVISVEDTGRGIKPEKIDKLFNKFERLEEDRNTTIEGAGLGLAITKKLVEMLGGKIVVQSVFESGSKFTFYIKQKIVDKKIEVKTNKNTELILTNKKVLIVDDNTLNIKVAERLLKSYGILVESCMSGYDCLYLLKSGKTYDLILMDDMMPKLSGTETLHLIEEIPELNTKVVVLTANAIEGMREKYIEEGFVDYLAKPIEKLELERILRTYLNQERGFISFEPLPKEMYEITDEEMKKINEQ